MNCGNKAEYIYSWNGKLMRGCAEHASQMKQIADAIGAPFDRERIESIEPAGECEHGEEK